MTRRLGFTAQPGYIVTPWVTATCLNPACCCICCNASVATWLAPLNLRSSTPSTSMSRGPTRRPLPLVQLIPILPARHLPHGLLLQPLLRLLNLVRRNLRRTWRMRCARQSPTRRRARHTKPLPTRLASCSRCRSVRRMSESAGTTSKATPNPTPRPGSTSRRNDRAFTFHTARPFLALRGLYVDFGPGGAAVCVCVKLSSS